MSLLPTAGRLPFCLNNWLKVTSDQWVIQVVKGYRLELTSSPSQWSSPGPLRTRGCHSIDEEVQKLITKGAVKEVPPCMDQFLSQIFLLPKKDGSARLVINLRPLNQFILQAHFKMESLGMMRDLLREGDWMASIDLKDAYLSVTIWEGHRKYLRFPWKDTIYEFQCLPFGLSSAPRVFTKLLKPVLARLRQQGIRLIMYLDDMLVMAQYKEELEGHLSQITSLLEDLGFVVNREKSQLIPTQIIQYLGFRVDSKEMKVRLSEEKATQIMSSCTRAREKGSISVRDLARLIGKMTATLPAIFPAPLWYRELQRLKNQALQRTQSFETPVRLNQEAVLELDWWSIKRNLIEGKSISAQEPDLIMETDASMLGWGAVCQGVRTGGLWSQTEGKNHINYLELLAAMFAVKAFTKDRRNILIHLRMDNRTAVFYVNRMGGTRSPVLSRLAIQLWRWCLERNLSITAEYLPGVDNCVADEESRAVQSTSEWQLHHPTFQQILATLGSCNIDLFATRLNAQLRQFVSWRPDPDAVGTDALQFLWSNWEGYAFPPFCLIGRCIKKIREDGATLIMVAPVWRSQPWYPALLELLVDFPLILPGIQMLLTDPFNNPHPLITTGQLQLAAWKLSGINSKQREFQAGLPSCWQQVGAGVQTQHTKVPGRDGIAGALNGKLIPFRVLSSHS